MKNKLLFILGNIVVVILLASFIFADSIPFLNRTTDKPLVIPATVVPITPEKKEVIHGKPARIIVPVAGIDLEVKDGNYDTKTGNWTLSLNTAHYAVMTPMANDTTGNTFIYGHARKGVFLSLPKVKEGDVAQIITDNGFVFTYTLASDKEVNPKDVSVFSYQGPPILTLQTCSGTWFQNRHLFTFAFQKVEKV